MLFLSNLQLQITFGIKQNSHTGNFELCLQCLWIQRVDSVSFSGPILISSLIQRFLGLSPFPLTVVIDFMISAASPADTVEDKLQMWKGNSLQSDSAPVLFII